MEIDNQSRLKQFQPGFNFDLLDHSNLMIIYLWSVAERLEIPTTYLLGYRNVFQTWDIIQGALPNYQDHGKNSKIAFNP